MEVAPEILEYLDYRAFLRDHLKHMHACNAKYSQRWVARQAGIKSPHLISMIISGSRSLNLANVRPLAQAMKLGERETSYLEILVELEEATDRHRQQELTNRIQVEFRNGMFRDIPTSGLEILKHWYLPVLRELVTLEDFQSDPKWIAEKIGITPQEAETGLSLLVEKGFLQVEQGSYRRSDPSIHTPEKGYPITIANFHLQMLERSFHGHAQTRENRYFEALTMGIAREDLPMFIEITKRYFREIDMLAESRDKKDAVYQVNLQLFEHKP